MKTAFDVVDLIIPIINVSGVTGTIDGDIYRSKMPRDSKDMNIVVIALPVRGGHPDDDDLASGTVMINIHCKNHEKNGVPNTTAFRATVAAIITALEAYADTETYFTFSVIGVSDPMGYPEQPDMSFVNIRLNYWIEY